MITAITQRQLIDLPNNYYLFDFTDEELIEVVAKPDEWNQLDYLLALKLLKERGKEVNPILADKLREHRIEELAKPEVSQKGMIYSGYALAVLGGIIGIGIGWTLSSQKKTLPNGNVVYVYSESDRKHGNRILWIATISFVLWIVLRLYVGANSF